MEASVCVVLKRKKSPLKKICCHKFYVMVEIFQRGYYVSQFLGIHIIFCCNRRTICCKFFGKCRLL